MKHIWITALSDNPGRIQEVGAVLQRYGLSATAHVWQDTLDKHYPRRQLEAMQASTPDSWLILADATKLQQPTVRYGLSLLSASLAGSSKRPAIFVLHSEANADGALPQVLQQAGAMELTQSSSNWPAKIVARLSKPASADNSTYSLCLWGNEQIGQWLELSPNGLSWDGLIVGVSGQVGATPAQINFQAVGTRGELPQKTTLKYAQQGLKIQATDREFSAWSLRNRIAPGHSYFFRIQGYPQHLLFLPYSEAEEAQATVLGLD